MQFPNYPGVNILFLKMLQLIYDRCEEGHGFRAYVDMLKAKDSSCRGRMLPAKVFNAPLFDWEAYERGKEREQEGREETST